MAFAFTAATVWLNVSAAHGDITGMVMHAAMPILFITFIEAVRHAIRRRAGIAAGTVREGVPTARWLLAPFSTFRLWRRMILWQITSYPDALQAEQRRRHALALLDDHYGRKWKRKPGRHHLDAQRWRNARPGLTRVTDLTTPEPPPRHRLRPSPRPHRSRRSRPSPKRRNRQRGPSPALIDAEPNITGAELGRRLNISSRQANAS